MSAGYWLVNDLFEIDTSGLKEQHLLRSHSCSSHIKFQLAHCLIRWWSWRIKNLSTDGASLWGCLSFRRSLETRSFLNLNSDLTCRIVVLKLFMTVRSLLEWSFFTTLNCDTSCWKSSFLTGKSSKLYSLRSSLVIAVVLCYAFEYLVVVVSCI